MSMMNFAASVKCVKTWRMFPSPGVIAALFAGSIRMFAARMWVGMRGAVQQSKNRPIETRENSRLFYLRISTALSFQ